MVIKRVPAFSTLVFYTSVSNITTLGSKVFNKYCSYSSTADPGFPKKGWCVKHAAVHPEAAKADIFWNNLSFFSLFLLANILKIHINDT